jgi:GNAT superfamily N-acetyltransferase
LSDHRVRPGTSTDVRPAFDVFRQSLWDYLERTGIVAPGTPNDIEATWRRQGPIVEYIVANAAEFWVAEDDDGISGLARSLERDGVLQLTEFFVHPRAQSRGVGRSLLEMAFPLGRGRHRSIRATQDLGAVALYLRFGVDFQATMIDADMSPKGHAYDTDLEFVSLSDVDEPVTAVGEIDRRLLDHDRNPELEFLVRDRPGFLYRRGADVVGYGFESNGTYAGPIGVLDPSDLPAALSHLENSAAEQEIKNVSIDFALNSRHVVDWVFARRHRLFGFYGALLTSDPFVPVERYVPYSPGLFL